MFIGFISLLGDHFWFSSFAPMYQVTICSHFRSPIWGTFGISYTDSFIQLLFKSIKRKKVEEICTYIVFVITYLPFLEHFVFWCGFTLLTEVMFFQSEELLLTDSFFGHITSAEPLGPFLLLLFSFFNCSMSTWFIFYNSNFIDIHYLMWDCRCVLCL